MHCGDMCSCATEATAQGSALLWAYYSSKQAIILSATRITHSWCKVFASRPWGFFSRYSGNWRKSQEQRQTSSDITQVPWAQEASPLDERDRKKCVLNIGPWNFVSNLVFTYFCNMPCLLQINKKSWGGNKKCRGVSCETTKFDQTWTKNIVSISQCKRLI